MTTLDLNRRLAEALGWTNIVDVGNALLGMPPWGIPEARGQAKVPNWAGCWKDCGPLISQYRINLDHLRRRVVASSEEKFFAQSPEFGDAEIRQIVVRTVTAKLEAAK